jgi:hypothetical protein
MILNGVAGVRGFEPQPIPEFINYSISLQDCISIPKRILNTMGRCGLNPDWDYQENDYPLIFLNRVKGFSILFYVV